MLRLLGIPVSDDDARRLIATLVVEGTPDALTAAGQLAKGVERGLYAVGLSRAERTAVLACLEDPPDGLVELRGALMREHRKLDVFCLVCWQREFAGSGVSTVAQPTGISAGRFSPTETIPALAHPCSGRADRLSPAARW